MSREIHLLRLPRLVTGHVGRKREAVPIATWDDVPVEIPSFSSSEAPEAYRRGPPGSGIRAREGACYDPAAGPGQTPSDCWQGIVDDVLPLLSNALGFGRHAKGSIYETFLPWRSALHGASRSFGFARMEDVRFREVLDDGLGAQAALVEGLSRRLAIVDGRLHTACGLPRIQVSVRDGRIQAFDGMPILEWGQALGLGEPWRANCFRIDRPDEAASFAAALHAATGRPLDASPPPLEILEPEALSECYARAGGEERLTASGVAGTLAGAVRTCLSHLPEEEVARYLALCALSRSGDPAALAGWAEGSDETRAAMVRCHGWAAPRDVIDGALSSFDLALLRIAQAVHVDDIPVLSALVP